ncbi:hypothetical protein ABZ442_30655 [Streptomyces triculaminicus]|uniref:hypothetical protein n=1 Tax=Streptomyces triculaminicus TaxID=2816232 RepID=UPI0033ECEBA9
MTSLSTYLREGGENGRFAAYFIAVHQGDREKAERCWDRQVNEILNDLQSANKVPYWERPAWAEDRAKWMLWFYAVLNQCAAPA